MKKTGLLLTTLLLAASLVTACGGKQKLRLLTAALLLNKPHSKWGSLAAHTKRFSTK
ncbi:hypothetical protein [Brevibacillus brevis]|uniref:hypothetical protein n=1 Tax=Brevibacillus brevis TaxID=1393 RepID=UPI00211AF167